MSGALAEFQRIIGAGVAKNWQLVTASVAVCFAIQFVSAQVAPALFPDEQLPAGASDAVVKKQRRKDRERRADFAIRVAAFVHASLVSVLCLRTIMTCPAEVVGNVYAFHAPSEVIFALSTGYFIWDTLTCVFGGWGVGFIAHGLACTFVYAASLYPFLHYWGLFFLLYELSTPFLHIRWLALQFGVHKSRPALFSVVQNAFVAAFVVVRLLAGSYASYHWWGDMLALLNGTYRASTGTSLVLHSTVVAYTYLTANVILNGLNWFWFSQMVAAKSGKSVKAKDSEPEDVAAAAAAATADTTTTTGTADGAASPTNRRTKKAE